MCGIAGIISPRPAMVQDVQDMISCIAHRGPDGDAVWQNENSTVILGHRRLAIIDLSNAAAQPMHYLNRYSIVHNGEIYNYKELREELSAKGYAFTTQSDTEVILAAYDHWKQDCLSHFDGMFAFAILDEKEQKLFAARDRFGEKPFYYVFQNEVLWFASEIKSFKNLAHAKDRNENFLLQYIANGFVQDATDAGATFYKNIKKLPARHFIEYSLSSGTLSITPYFDIDKSITTVSPESAIEQFRQLFFDSVAKRLRSDVAIGTSLSGGIDSSSVLAVIHHLKETQTVQNAFTVGFPGFEKDETAWANRIALQLDIQKHFHVNPNEHDLVFSLDKFFAAHDEPVSSTSVYAQYRLYEAASQQGIKVMLDGQGADEILAGYTKYVQWYLQELYKTKSPLLNAELKAFDASFGLQNKLAASFPSLAAIHLEKKASRNLKQSFFTRDFFDENQDKSSIYKPVVKNLNDILYFDVFGGKLEELLRNADRNAMAHGVEVRLPFLNHQLVQFVFSLPSSFKMHSGFTKYILRQAMDYMLPEEITWRKDKIGFEPPQHQWMKNAQLQDRIHEAKKKLVQEKVLKTNILSKPVQPVAAHEAGNYDWRFLSAAQIL